MYVSIFLVCRGRQFTAWEGCYVQQPTTNLDKKYEKKATMYRTEMADLAGTWKQTG